MILADLLLLFDKKLTPKEEPDEPVEVPGDLWEAWLREAWKEAKQRDEDRVGGK